MLTIAVVVVTSVLCMTQFTSIYAISHYMYIVHNICIVFQVKQFVVLDFVSIIDNVFVVLYEDLLNNYYGAV